MPLTRGILSGLGLDKDQISAIMNAREEILEGYVTVKASEQATEKAVAEAVEAAKKDAPGVPDVAKAPEYIKLQGDFEAYKKRTEARGSDDFKGVKGKFFDSVYDRLDHEKPYKEQLEALKKDYGEFFETEQTQTQQTTSGGFNPPPAGSGQADALEKQIQTARESGNMAVLASLLRQAQTMKK